MEAYSFKEKEIKFYRNFGEKYKRMKRFFPAFFLLTSLWLVWESFRLTARIQCELPAKYYLYHIALFVYLLSAWWALAISMKQISKLIFHIKESEKKAISNDEIPILFHDT